jgi:hypothetical protein
MSGFGLSAFFYSTLSHVLFPGNTSDFLLVLALGTALPMILGLFIVRPIPLPNHVNSSAIERGAANAYRRVSFDGAPAAIRANSQTRLLSPPPQPTVPEIYVDEDDETMEAVYTEFSHPSSQTLHAQSSLADSVQLSPSIDSIQNRSRSRSSPGRREVFFNKLPDGRGVNVHRLGLLRSADFYIACLLNVLCTFFLLAQMRWLT